MGRVTKSRKIASFARESSSGTDPPTQVCAMAPKKSSKAPRQPSPARDEDEPELDDAPERPPVEQQQK